MRKIKVGDIVKIKKDLSLDNEYKISIDHDMLQYKGWEAAIVYVDSDDNTCQLDVDIGRWWWSEDMFELCSPRFTKGILESGDMVELRNGERYIFIKDAKHHQYDEPTDVFMGINSLRCIPLNYYNDSLLNLRGDKSCDIMKISDGFYIPNIFRAQPSATLTIPDWVLEREEVKEMTLEEVCKELGRDIKIVKEH